VGQYVKVEQTGSDITISVDSSGTGNFTTGGQVVVLEGYDSPSGTNDLTVLIDDTDYHFTV